MTKHHLLIVEPGEDMQELYKSIFNKHQNEFTVQIVRSGEAALEFMEHSSVDLLLLSWTLPLIPASDVLQVLRAKNKTRNLPVVVMADALLDEDRVEALRLGADHYQAKGFNPEALLARIRQLLPREVPPRNILTSLLLCFPISI